MESRQQIVNKKRELGFTLLEITFAIIILSGSLVVLVGLQSSVAERSIYDDNRKYAMHTARQILTVIETLENNQEPIEPQDITLPPDKLLEELLGTNFPPIERSTRGKIELSARLNVQGWSIPGIPDAPEDLMKKIEVTVSWSEDPRDQFYTVYFIPFN